ncbi:class I SAM-dependent methyltransferase [Paenibacillus sp. GXUN7292]|uniref:class I SAM-dependent methyltransferase n=1 Tax=Paenibacillus sp. GXUN7292 TaxID=3422499 RepID=UPI003D7F1159
MPDQWQQYIHTWVEKDELLQATLSQPRRKDGSIASKTIVRAVLLKNVLHFQFEYHVDNKVLHENVDKSLTSSKLVSLIEENYRQVLFKTRQEEVQLLLSKKGKAAMRSQKAAGKVQQTDLQHNRQKQRVLEEGTAVPFLVELGIMAPDGTVRAKKQDKYRQINRFLEMVSDILPALPADRPLTIVDFGCGKSYLTFALYHLLAVQQGREISIIGLDLKADVIAFCSELARKLGYDKLKFLVGDIADYEELQCADMVVTLHACDTATDAALAKAVRWGASVIMSVPCCQHELFRQIENEALSPLLSHGLLKERFSALATDAARGQLLEVAGYKVQMLEFIDAEHTPKNIMIRATRSQRQGKASAQWQEYLRYKELLHITPALEKMLFEDVKSEMDE